MQFEGGQFDLFGYVGNDPINLRDSRGTQLAVGAIIVSGVVGGIFGGAQVLAANPNASFGDVALGVVFGAGTGAATAAFTASAIVASIASPIVRGIVVSAVTGAAAAATSFIGQLAGGKGVDATQIGIDFAFGTVGGGLSEVGGDLSEAAGDTVEVLPSQTLGGAVGGLLDTGATAVHAGLNGVSQPVSNGGGPSTPSQSGQPVGSLFRPESTVPHPASSVPTINGLSPSHYVGGGFGATLQAWGVYNLI
jgi:hypothetical protein